MKRRKARARPHVQPRIGSRRLLLPSLTAFIGIAILLGLGFWQVERKQWKEALIATLTAGIAASAGKLEQPVDRRLGIPPRAPARQLTA
jgi:cytochrome oxidase assembly protein ShyY1